MKDKKGINTKSAIRELVQSTKDALLLSSEIQITGNNCALIQGTKGILEYNEDSVRIKLLQDEIRFFGENLVIRSLSQDSIELSGKITRMEFGG